MSFWAEISTFLRQSRGAFGTTGSVWPSSRFGGQALAAPLAGARPAARILEAGPGTGAVTRQIVRHLQPGDRLDVVELNEAFHRYLGERIAAEPCYAHCRAQITLIRAPVQELPGEGVYDHIVSGLPLNNFDPSLIEEVFAAFQRLLRPGGALSYFEYAWIRHLKTPFAGRAERARLRAVSNTVDRFIADFEYQHRLVLLNVPPMVVRYLRFKPGTAERSCG
jgi:phospholipid N-methyltransferase